MKCLPKNGFFRRSRLGPPHQQPQSPLTPQHPKARLRQVNDIIRRSLSSSGVKIVGLKRPSFGGTTDDGAKECTSADSLSDITRENEWFLLNIEETLPCARSKHGVVASGGNMYVVGGDSVEGQLGDVQVFNMEQFSWKQVHCSSGLEAVKGRSRESGDFGRSASLIPAGGPRLVAPFVGLWKKKLIVVGCEDSASNDSLVSVHAFDPLDGTWSALRPKGGVPEARVGYRIVQVKSRLIMFGGEDASGRIVDDIFILDLEKLAWLSLRTTGMRPAPRKYHAMVCYGGRYMWIYGGKSYATYFNDIYCLDLKFLMWTNVKAEGSVPAMPRAGHVGVMQGEKFFIVGGENRGDEMVDTLVFDIQKLTWSVVTSVNAMSPLAHNGLSVIKVKHKGKEYLVAFGGHGILLSCQVYALLLPSVDEVSGCLSLSSLENLNLKSSSKHSTLSQVKTSPTDPFQFHRATSLSSSSLDSDATVAAADNRYASTIEESPISAHKERPRVRSRSGSLDFDSWEITPLRDLAYPKSAMKRTGRSKSGELSKPARLSEIIREDLPPLSQHETGHCKEDCITTKNNSQSGRLDDELCSIDGTTSLKVLFETQDHSHQLCDSPQTGVNKTGHEDDPHSFDKKILVDTGAINKQLRVVAKAIKELQEAQKSSLVKDEDLSGALHTIKELQEEIHELRRNKEDQERKIEKKLSSIELMIDKQSGRENTPEIEHRTEVARDTELIRNKRERSIENRKVAEGR